MRMCIAYTCDIEPHIHKHICQQKFHQGHSLLRDKRRG